jgi:hypothetical protein
MTPLSRRRLLKSTLALSVASPFSHAFAEPPSGLLENLIAESGSPADFPLAHAGTAAPLFVDAEDFPGVLRAGHDLQADIERVTSIRPALAHAPGAEARHAILIGTLGKSPTIDRLAASGKIDARPIKGQWESFLISTVDNPLPGIDRALVIAGSDRRGSIYGIYEISEQIGVSPWYWWADVPPRKRPDISIRSGSFIQGPPVVKYRGIFINDEEPCFGGWSRARYGGVNSVMYAHVFELLLRLRANYLWPAMWGKAFNEDDPRNPVVADEYGIVMGTSHEEPMMRAQQEWDTHHLQYGNGQWNYLTNAAGLRQYWAYGIHRVRNYENLVTVGMRGDGDKAMPSAGSFAADKALLERIIHDQRVILQQQLHRDPSEVPQVWALFTEVLKYYEAGMNVPDDVTLLFTDDNVGNLRRVPSATDRKRKGGSGIYFHMDMNGGPFSYKWINSNPLPKIWEQMNLACEYGATRIWIGNIGDLKPLEIPMEFFLRMAWNPQAMRRDGIARYQRLWAQREFGPEHASAIAEVVAKYAKYNGWRKPELVKPNTFSLPHYREAERVSAAWNRILVQAEDLNAKLPPETRPAFYELVLHTVRACANLNDMYIAAARNALYAEQGRASTNAEAARVREMFEKDQQFSDYYNKTLMNGKWNHMMDQTHIGYTSWMSPVVNIMPAVTEVDLPDSADIGVAVDGSPRAWPVGPASPFNDEPILPPFDSLTPARSYIDVFARGTRPLAFHAAADKPWVRLTETAAPGAGGDRRLWVSVDWQTLPPGSSHAVVTVTGANGHVPVHVTAIKATQRQEREARDCFGGLVGPIAFAAESATGSVPVNGVRWQRIPDYGRGISGMEVFPVTASTVQPPAPAPRLEYPVFFAKAGLYHISVTTSPTLDIVPERKLGLAVSFDDGPLQVVDVFSPETRASETFLGHDYYENDANNARIMHFSQTVATPGRHILRLTMVDPTVVVEKIVIHSDELPPSYFGPPCRSLNGHPEPAETW